MKIRVWKLAKELGMSSKELIDYAEGIGISVKSPLANLEDKQVKTIQNSIKQSPGGNKKDKKEPRRDNKIDKSKNNSVANTNKESSHSEATANKKDIKSDKRHNQGKSPQGLKQNHRNEKDRSGVNRKYSKDRRHHNQQNQNSQNQGQNSAQQNSVRKDVSHHNQRPHSQRPHNQNRQDSQQTHRPQQQKQGLNQNQGFNKQKQNSQTNQRDHKTRQHPQTQRFAKKPPENQQDNRGSGNRNRQHNRHGYHTNRRDKHRFNKGDRKSKERNTTTVLRERPIDIVTPIAVKDLSQLLGIRTSQIIGKIFSLYNTKITINQVLEDNDFVEAICLEFGKKVNIKKGENAEESFLKEFEQEADSPEDLTTRAPVVTFLGHVDHGKTSLLDKIRKTNVASKEAGGITQHIGAYKVNLKNNSGSIVFLDTPGHEAFTSMRARGANVTDIVVLIVAADDGVMPQTIEAINHAKAAEVPIIVAVNKIDKPSANMDTVLQQLARHNLIAEQWQGDTICVGVSAMSGQGIDELLEYITLVAEMQELKANKKRRAVGTVLESKLKEGKGNVATLLVQNGTLKRGDFILCGGGYGKVRDIIDHKLKKIKEAGPSTPVEISGLSDVPEAGEKFYVLSSLAKAKDIAELRQKNSREKVLSQGTRKLSIEEMMRQLQAGTTKELNVILKADVQGSVEALAAKIQELSHDEIKIKLLHSGVGGVNERDVQLAFASQALILAFSVVATKPARDLAEDKGVEVKRYNVIYHLLDDLKKIMSGMLPPEKQEKIIGHAVIRKIIRISKVGNIAGCYVTDGNIERNSKIRISRQGVLLNRGKQMELTSLKRFKEDTGKVKEGFECGMRFSDFEDFKEGDEIEAFQIIEVARTID